MKDDCASCIYPGGGDCIAPALRDALALLKAQEARVLSLEEVAAWDGPLVVEERCCGGRLTWALYYGEYYPALRFQLPGCVLVLPTAVYGEDWRCWTAWPDDDARRWPA